MCPCDLESYFIPVMAPCSFKKIHISIVKHGHICIVQYSLKNFCLLHMNSDDWF